MSFSSSSGSGIFSYISSDSTMTWQVEQAQDPPQAPGESVSVRESGRAELEEGKLGHTLHF